MIAGADFPPLFLFYFNTEAQRYREIKTKTLYLCASVLEIL